MVAKEHRDTKRGRQALRFTIPDAFVDGGGVIVECRAFEMGPRGGTGNQVQLTPEYWRALLAKLAEAQSI